MVHEGRVLFRVQHLEHRRRRVAPEVLSHLVDLVEQDERVCRLGLLQRLDDLAGHGADIGPPVAADLAFIAHAAQADADELAPRRLGDRPAKRGLADARRADEAQDRAFQLVGPRLHGEIFDDPLLDLFQTVVVGVQHLLGAAKVLLGARLHAPRQRQQPVEVVAADRRLGRHRRHRLKLLQLGFRLFAGFLAELGCRDLLFQFGDLVLALVAIPQLALDRLHLLVEIVLALRLLHLGLDAGLDLLLDLQDGHLALHQAVYLFQPLGDVQRVQQVLLAGDVDAEMARHEVGQHGRLARLADGGHGFLGNVLADLDVALELFGHGADKRGHAVGVAGQLGQRFGRRLEMGVVLDEAGDGHALAPLDQHLDGAVGQFQQLQDVRQHAGAVDPVLARLVDRGVLLRGQQDRRVAVHHRLECADGFLAPDEQRHDHVGEHDDVTQRKHGIGVRGRCSGHPGPFVPGSGGPVMAARQTGLRVI